MAHHKSRNRTGWRWTRWVTLGLAVTVTSSCAVRNVPIASGSLAALKDVPPLKMVRYQPPTFTIEHPANSVVQTIFGVSGGDLVMPGQSPGPEPLETEYALDDPAIAVRDNVAEALTFELGVRRDESPAGAPLADDRVETLAAAVGRDGWLLDVKTLHWGLSYDPALRTRYRIQVQARGRLIDLSRERVVWQALCDGSEGEAPKGSIMGELTANDAALLKERLTSAAHRCAKELVAHLFAEMK